MILEAMIAVASLVHPSPAPPAATVTYAGVFSSGKGKEPATGIFHQVRQELQLDVDAAPGVGRQPAPPNRFGRVHRSDDDGEPLIVPPRRLPTLAPAVNHDAATSTREPSTPSFAANPGAPTAAPFDAAPAGPTYAATPGAVDPATGLNSAGDVPLPQPSLANKPSN